ncbi:hypothetical protein ABNU38_13965 [Citrobacter braakii]|uniref:hypothetical protein n=1 Tax=Citrobacter braakii TaxID=57706 RepID=UPI00339CEB04
MKIDLDIKAQGIDVSTSGYRDFVNVEIRGVEIKEVLGEIENPMLFAAIDMDEYIEWADSHSRLPQILELLSADEVIEWLHENGHLEGVNG